MNLLGVDVGFSKDRKTTGLAWRIGRVVEVKKTGTLWDERSKYVKGKAYMLRRLMRLFCLSMRVAHTANANGCSMVVPFGTVAVRA